jgi:hypothetical protein
VFLREERVGSQLGACNILTTSEVRSSGDMTKKYVLYGILWSTTGTMCHTKRLE